MSKPKLTETRISYLDLLWSPINGCSECSPACDNCWSREMARRFKRPWGAPVMHPYKLELPLHEIKPAVIGVCFTSDLFHPAVPDDFIFRVCDNIARAPWHKYIFLTKRWERMCKLTHPMLDHLRNNGDPVAWGFTVWDQDSALKVSELVDKHFIRCDNVWLSLEPLLAPVNTRSLYLFNGVITGCEQISGGRTGRPAPRWWFRSLQYACHEDNRPFYLKQQGEYENGEGKVVHYPPKPEELAWELKRKPSLSHTETTPKEQP